jgi:alpha-galactosidase
MPSATTPTTPTTPSTGPTTATGAATGPSERPGSGTPSVAFIGAGSVEFTRDLVADILRFPELRGVDLRLHDIDPGRLETAQGVARQVARQVGAAPVISVHPERRSALDGADFVVNMVAVGGHDATRTDFDVPARFGLRQTIADTLGVGGIFRHLRTSVLLDALAADMLAVCPDAWLLNYTNPMAMNLQFLAERAPALKAVGLCHSVYWTVVGLCELIDVPYSEVSYASAGVNHQAWLLRWERDGESLYPLLDARIAADPELRRRTRVDLYRRFGYYPTETSEHSSEYVPWYLHHDEEVERLRLPVGAYLTISEENLAEYAATRARLAAGEDLEFGDTTEYAPQVIHSMVTGTPRTIVGTTANRGLISNLPEGAGVEVPCVVDRLGVRPIAVGALPPQCAAVNRAFLGPVELAVRAALDGDPRLVRQAAMLDPNTAASLRVDQIWDLCDALVTAHGDLLPEPLRVLCPLGPGDR